MKKIKLHLNYAGYCWAKQSLSLKTGKNKNIKFQSLFGLMHHEDHGWILFDTGYSRRFHDLTKRFPNKIFALVTKVKIDASNEVANQLKHFNLEPSDISHVIISHFHPDHIGGLKDFNAATFYCSKEALDNFNAASDFWSFKTGILKNLVPDDFYSRVKIIDEYAKPFHHKTFGTSFDLFADNSILIHPLSGHASGLIGIEIETIKKRYFLVSDACWNIKTITHLVLPPSYAVFMMDSWRNFKKTVKKLNVFYHENPETGIIPTHCTQTTSKFVNDAYSMDTL